MTTDYAELIKSFEACDIDASSFSHIDHLGVAYEMLRRYDFLNACVKYADCISTIATKAGADRKFNMTVTLAFLSIIAERMETEPASDFDTFLQRNRDLVSGNPLAKWYSADRLNSDAARHAFLMPDVAA